MFSLAAVAKRTAVSTAMAHALPQPSGAVGAAAVSPAPVTMLLAAETTLSVADLTGIDNYNSVAVSTIFHHGRITYLREPRTTND